MIASYLTMDISRLLSRSHAAAPTGIDRVELAYAEYLIESSNAQAEFFALHPWGYAGTLNLESARHFIDRLATRWRSPGIDDKRGILASRSRLHRQMLFGSARRPVARQRHGAYLLLSHHHLTHPRLIARTLAMGRKAFIPMLHDLIPNDYPEYAHQREAAKHLRRLETVTRFADGVLVPSESVRQTVLRHLDQAGRSHVPVCKVLHGIDPELVRPVPSASSGRPYFVCLGTIEPRKNHLLLLNIWRRLVEERGEHAPRLVLIGRRGWENENVIDMIERCKALQGVVQEYSSLPDAQVRQLLCGARALLFPSFAEGFGLPLTEAMALGVPVICSDIPVFKEVGGAYPEFLDPIDGLGWLAAIERYSSEPAPAARPALYSKPWRESVAEAMAFVDTVTASLA